MTQLSLVRQNDPFFLFSLLRQIVKGQAAAKRWPRSGQAAAKRRSQETFDCSNIWQFATAVGMDCFAARATSQPRTRRRNLHYVERTSDNKKKKKNKLPLQHDGSISNATGRNNWRKEVHPRTLCLPFRYTTARESYQLSSKGWLRQR